MTFDRLKWTYRAWRYRQRLERQEIRLLLRHLAAGDVAVDVGAHKGAYTYWMRRAVGASGTIRTVSEILVEQGWSEQGITLQGLRNVGDRLTFNLFTAGCYY